MYKQKYMHKYISPPKKKGVDPNTALKKKKSKAPEAPKNETDQKNKKASAKEEVKNETDEGRLPPSRPKGLQPSDKGIYLQVP